MSAISEFLFDIITHEPFLIEETHLERKESVLTSMGVRLLKYFLPTFTKSFHGYYGYSDKSSKK